MGKKLIITEKPSVAQDYAKVFGVSGRRDGYIEDGNYVITWCVGHLVEMVYPEEYDERYKRWNLDDLPFLPRDYKYGVISNVKKQYDIVNGLLHREDIDTVYWAGDSGKEGQTIEENIRNYGGVRSGMKELRVWIDSQTEEEIRRGVNEAKPMSDYANLGKSGIMRSIEDYAMGINFSRVMSVKYGRLLNDAAATQGYTAIAVGRVMTCVLGMVVNREREIRNFNEKAFYRVVGSFGADNADEAIEAEWKAVEGSEYFESPKLYKENGFNNEEDAKSLIDLLDGKEAIVKSLEKGTSKKRAPLLFNLAELQAECSKRFKISPDETLQVAQDLYERKLTTYPRTDARVLTKAVAKEISKILYKLKEYEPVTGFVNNILQRKAHVGLENTYYVDDSKVTDHYAIIPTGQTSQISGLNPLQAKVYDLILRRFLSIFYPAAEYETLKLTVQVDSEYFFAGAKQLKLPGYLEVAGKAPEPQKESKDDEGDETGENSVENSKKLFAKAGSLREGDKIEVAGYEIKEGKTKPPKRYTSGSMILAMENAGQLIEDEELRAQIKGSGIGTSATRAEIIKKLIRIGYLNLNPKTQVISPKNFGEMVYEVVDMTVPTLLNPKMTASWEKGLDGITRGTVDVEEYRSKLEDFIRKETIQIKDSDLTKQLAVKISNFSGKGAKGPGAMRKIGVPCPDCGGDMVTTPFGFGCSNYKKDGTGCGFSIGQIAGRDMSETEVKTLITEGKTETLRGFKGKTSKKKFDACLVLDKDENGKHIIKFDFDNVVSVKLQDVVCPICGGEIEVTGFGYSCVNHQSDNPESCKFSIGKMLGKDLSQASVKELLTNGRTGTIRGFTSKTGKKFDARVALNRDEQGKVTGLKFDFEDLEKPKLKDAKCPLCGGEILKTTFGYGCSNYNKDDEANSCRFAIGKIGGVKLNDTQTRQLINEKKTDIIKGFKSKAGKKFDAPLRLTESGQVEYDFPEPEKTTLMCPRCKEHNLEKDKWSYNCQCGYRVGHTVAGVPISTQIMEELFKSGKTSEIITGFTSKAGKSFDAYLKYENENISFEFNSSRNEENTNGTADNNTDDNSKPLQLAGDNSSKPV